MAALKKKIITIDKRLLLIHGLIILPAFLLQQSVPVRIIQVLFFLLTLLLLRKKTGILFAVISITGITLVNALVPSGRVIFTLQGFPLTMGAIRLGLLKSTTFTGLLFISRLSVSADTALPGRAGRFIGRVLTFFQALERIRFVKGSLTGQIDAALLRILKTDADAPTEAESSIKDENDHISDSIPMEYAKKNTPHPVND